MTLTERMQKAEEQRRMPSNVIPFDAPRQRREPIKWWEKAQSGQLVSKDFTNDGGRAA